MVIKLVLIGKTDKGFVLDGVEEYVKRLKHYISFTTLIIPDIKNAGSLSPLQLKDMQAALLLKALSPQDKVVLLDEHGKEMKSTEFADFLQKEMNSGIKTLVFVVGGAYGFSESVKEKFQTKFSISRMTFSHQMIRLLFTEQLYRAFTILRHEPYHNE